MTALLDLGAGSFLLGDLNFSVASSTAGEFGILVEPTESWDKADLSCKSKQKHKSS